jgi:hypothetical protein
MRNANYDEESDNNYEEESDKESYDASYEASYDESNEESYEDSNEEIEYEDELNYKKQLLKSFYNYLEVVIKSIDDKKHNKKIINKLYYIIDKYYKNNYDKESHVSKENKESKESKESKENKENNIFESFINKTIDINKRLIKAEDNSNSILILNNFITKTLIY